MKGYRTPILNSTQLRATKKLGRDFVDLRGHKRTPPLSGARYVMLAKDDYSHHAWVHFLKNKSDSGDAFTECFADTRANGLPSKCEIEKV